MTDRCGNGCVAEHVWMEQKLVCHLMTDRLPLSSVVLKPYYLDEIRLLALSHCAHARFSTPIPSMVPVATKKSKASPRTGLPLACSARM